MVDPQPIAKQQAPTASCMHCGYDLRGSPSEKCPECGKIFDPAKHRRRLWRDLLIALAVMIFVMYAPFCWLFFVNDDPGYVGSWMELGPMLPGLVPTYLISGLLFGHPFEGTTSKFYMTTFTILVLLIFIWEGSRSRKALIISAIILLALSCLNSFIALQLFRM